jgi:hypothetical protein
MSKKIFFSITIFLALLFIFGVNTKVSLAQTVNNNWLKIIEERINELLRQILRLQEELLLLRNSIPTFQPPSSFLPDQGWVNNSTSSATSSPWIYPQDGQVLNFGGSYMFKVRPASSTRYQFIFAQNGFTIHDNYRDLRTLSENGEYAIHPNSSYYGNFRPGILDVIVRALKNNQWSIVGTIRVLLATSSLPASINIISPNGGETLVQGMTQYITVRQNNVGNANLCFYLYRNDRIFRNIGCGLSTTNTIFSVDLVTSTNTGEAVTYVWQLPQFFVSNSFLGDGYKIFVSGIGADGRRLSDVSDRSFRIVNRITMNVSYDLNRDRLIDGRDLDLLRSVVLGESICPFRVSCDLNASGAVGVDDLITLTNYLLTLYDINGDGRVDNADQSFLLHLIFSGSGFCPINRVCDLNNDGRIDIRDSTILTNYIQYLRSSSDRPSLPTSTLPGSTSTVVFPPSLTVIAPNGGERLELGSVYKIEWRLANFTSNDTVDLSLVRLVNNSDNLEVVNNIISGVSSTVTAYNWTIPSNVVPGSYYKIRITKSGDNIYDLSDSFFSIVASSTSSTSTVSTSSALFSPFKQMASLLESMSVVLGNIANLLSR